jgi:hypothetical protein
VRSGGIWSQQGSKLVASDSGNFSAQGSAVSLSADGNTLAVGGSGDNIDIGATWVFVRLFGVWTQQGLKLVGIGGVGVGSQGNDVSLSADGDTLAVGGPANNTTTGAVWIFLRINGIWTQEAGPFTAVQPASSPITTPPQFGLSLFLSADGNTLAVGGNDDNSNTGAVWIFRRRDTVWTQFGVRLVGNPSSAGQHQGVSVALSSDGSILASVAAGNGSVNGGVFIFQ